jgi:nicotinamide-nucleotide amidase
LGLGVATAESCTGGLVGAAITAIPGASAVFDRGLITYSNQAKQDLLGVPAALLDQFGAVSEPVARAMARGAVARSGVDLAVAITGVAGPGGGTPEKPVGLVHFAVAGLGGETTARAERFGPRGRLEIQLSAVRVALEMLLERASSGRA